MQLYEEDRLKKKDVDRYSHQWIPDRWSGDVPSGNNKEKQIDLRSAEEKAESHKRWALSAEEVAENLIKYNKWFEIRKNAKGLW